MDKTEGRSRLEKSLKVQESELETIQESLKGMQVD
jgi:hypothetical protein